MSFRCNVFVNIQFCMCSCSLYREAFPCLAMPQNAPLPASAASIQKRKWNFKRILQNSSYATTHIGNTYAWEA